MNYKRGFQNNKVVWKWLLRSTASWQFEELTLKIWESKELIKDLRKEERKKRWCAWFSINMRFFKILPHFLSSDNNGMCVGETVLFLQVFTFWLTVFEMLKSYSLYLNPWAVIWPGFLLWFYTSRTINYKIQ